MNLFGGYFSHRSTSDPKAGENGGNVDDEEKIEQIPPMIWKSQTPEMDANIFSGVLFFWLQPLFTRASLLQRSGRALEFDDLPPLPSIDLSKSVEAKFERAYHDYKTKKVASSKTATTVDDDHAERDAKSALEARLVHSLLAICKQRLITAGIIKFFNTGLQFTFPILLNQILVFFQQYQSGAIPDDAPNAIRYRGYWLSCLLFFFIACKAITEGAYFHKVNRCAWQIKTAVSTSIYTKALRLAASEQQKTTLGEMVNLMQVDATKLEAFVPQIHVLWDGMFQIAGYMTILGLLLGWPCVIGLILMCFAGPVMGIIMGKLFAINRSMVKFTDERVKTVNEGLQGIRCVKMYTWEGQSNTLLRLNLFVFETLINQLCSSIAFRFLPQDGCKITRRRVGVAPTHCLSPRVLTRVHDSITHPGSSCHLYCFCLRDRSAYHGSYAFFGSRCLRSVALSAHVYVSKIKASCSPYRDALTNVTQQFIPWRLLNMHRPKSVLGAWLSS